MGHIPGRVLDCFVLFCFCFQCAGVASNLRTKQVLLVGSVAVDADETDGTKVFHDVHDSAERCLSV